MGWAVSGILPGYPARNLPRSYHTTLDTSDPSGATNTVLGGLVRGSTSDEKAAVCPPPSVLIGCSELMSSRSLNDYDPPWLPFFLAGGMMTASIT